MSPSSPSPASRDITLLLSALVASVARVALGIVLPLVRGASNRIIAWLEELEVYLRRLDEEEKKNVKDGTQQVPSKEEEATRRRSVTALDVEQRSEQLDVLQSYQSSFSTTVEHRSEDGGDCAATLPEDEDKSDEGASPLPPLLPRRALTPSFNTATSTSTAISSSLTLAASSSPSPTPVSPSFSPPSYRPSHLAAMLDRIIGTYWASPSVPSWPKAGPSAASLRRPPSLLASLGTPIPCLIFRHLRFLHLSDRTSSRKHDSSPLLHFALVCRDFAEIWRGEQWRTITLESVRWKEAARKACWWERGVVAEEKGQQRKDEDLGAARTRAPWVRELKITCGGAIVNRDGKRAPRPAGVSCRAARRAAVGLDELAFARRHLGRVEALSLVNLNCTGHRVGRLLISAMEGFKHLTKLEWQSACAEGQRHRQRRPTIMYPLFHILCTLDHLTDLKLSESWFPWSLNDTPTPFQPPSNAVPRFHLKSLATWGSNLPPEAL